MHSPRQGAAVAARAVRLGRGLLAARGVIAAVTSRHADAWAAHRSRLASEHELAGDTGDMPDASAREVLKHSCGGEPVGALSQRPCTLASFSLRRWGGSANGWVVASDVRCRPRLRRGFDQARLFRLHLSQATRTHCHHQGGSEARRATQRHRMGVAGRPPRVRQTLSRSSCPTSSAPR